QQTLPPGGVGGASGRNPIPMHVGQRSPIKHVFYIIKENRTYDQVFGALPQGNGDPSLVQFGRDVTPNHHALAEKFVLLDNLYGPGDQSALGHRWILQAYPSTYVTSTGMRGTTRARCCWVRRRPSTTTTPRATVADNDLALGKIVEAISKSRYWKDSAIFVTEDDSQGGLDHVDGHRTVGLVISPYTQRGVARFTRSSTCTGRSSRSSAYRG
ncbi:MAG: hypothetical protein ACREXY_09940, partial [Gammaproteobacteria bacterium]